MVDAYWLNSSSSLLADGSTDQQLSDTSRSKLAEAQAQDLVERYGKHEGLLHSYLFMALGDKNEILGLVGMEVRLCDQKANVIHSTQKSEQMLRDALSMLSPQEQRRIKENIECVPELANDFMAPEIGAVCVLSNLCVSPKARRKGLATKLCLEVERVAGTICGCEHIYLEVEEENIAARSLYKDRLGFQLQCTGEAPSKRVDPASGQFVDIMSPTVVMSKQID
jgi:GNAT superfamily N-acetyltransferase